MLSFYPSEKKCNLMGYPLTTAPGSSGFEPSRAEIFQKIRGATPAVKRREVLDRGPLCRHQAAMPEPGWARPDVKGDPAPLAHQRDSCTSQRVEESAVPGRGCSPARGESRPWPRRCRLRGGEKGPESRMELRPGGVRRWP